MNIEKTQTKQSLSFAAIWLKPGDLRRDRDAKKYNKKVVCQGIEQFIQLKSRYQFHKLTITIGSFILITFYNLDRYPVLIHFMVACLFHRLGNDNATNYAKFLRTKKKKMDRIHGEVND